MIDKKAIAFLICQSNDSLIGNSLSLLEAQNKDIGVVSHVTNQDEVTSTMQAIQDLMRKIIVNYSCSSSESSFSLDNEALSSISVSSSAQFISAKSLRL